MREAGRRGVRRRHSRRAFFELAAGAGVLAVLNRLAPSTAAQGVPALPSLVVGTNFDIKTLDTGRELEEGTNNVAKVAYDQLVTFQGGDLKTVRPSLASSWSLSADGRAYTFHLRPNVKFTSGNPLTSADVKWSFDRQMTLKGNAAFFLDGVDEIQAPDPLTVVLRLHEPRPSLLPTLASPVLSVLDSKVVIAHGGDASPDAKVKDSAERYLNGQSAGSGPFVLTSYTPAQDIVLVANPAHWRGAPHLSRVILRNITEPATQELEIQKGTLDLAVAIGPDQARALERSPNVQVRTAPVANLFYLMMNNNPQVGGPFSNPKVQQAVRYAIDYDGMLSLAGTGATRLAGVIPTVFPGALPVSEAPKMDRARARSLLQEANAGATTGVLTYGSDTLFYGVQNAIFAQKVQEDLSSVGIRLSLNGLPTVVALQQYRDGKNQLGLWAWASVLPDVSYYLGFVPGRTGPAVRAGWLADAGPDARQIVDIARQAASEMDGGKRAALYQQWNRKVAEVGPWVTLFQPVVPYAFRSNIRGAVFSTAWEVDYYEVSKP